MVVPGRTRQVLRERVVDRGASIVTFVTALVRSRFFHGTRSPRGLAHDVERRPRHARETREQGGRHRHLGQGPDGIGQEVARELAVAALRAGARARGEENRQPRPAAGQRSIEHRPFRFGGARGSPGAGRLAERRGDFVDRRERSLGEAAVEQRHRGPAQERGGVCHGTHKRHERPSAARGPQ